MDEYGINIISSKNEISSLEGYQAIILAVAHKEFLDINIRKTENQVVFDVKAILPKENVDARL